MKKTKKVLLVVFVIIVVLVALVYGGVFLGHKVVFKEEFSATPTIEPVTNGTYTFGPQVLPDYPTTVEAFIPLLAQQLKRYNEVAPGLWVDNPMVNQTLIIENTRNGKFWLIEPNGTSSAISKKDAMKYDFSRNAYVDGFSFFDGGMYYALADEDVANVLRWQKYLHLGTNDAILFLTHEGFHSVEQLKWSEMDDAPNQERDEYEANVEARAKRSLLQKQLLKAVSEPGNQQLILEALATYDDWIKKFPEDYRDSYIGDRIEGTAYYYELVSGLYIGYPDQVKTREDVGSALALLATRPDIYIDHGLVAEGYMVGGFSCVLLDRLGIDWQKQFASDPTVTPLGLLRSHFSDEQLPAPVQVTQTDVDEVSEALQSAKDSRPQFFRFLYDILF